MLNKLHELFSNSGNAMRFANNAIFIGIGEGKEIEELEQLKYEADGLVYHTKTKTLMIDTPFRDTFYTIEAGGEKMIAFAEYEYDHTETVEVFGETREEETSGRDYLRRHLGQTPDDIEEVELDNDGTITNVIFELPTIKITSHPEEKVAYMYFAPDANIPTYGYRKGEGAVMTLEERHQFEEVLEVAVYTHLLDMYDLTFYENHRWDGDRYPKLLWQENYVPVTPMIETLKDVSQQLNILGFSHGPGYHFVRPFMDNLNEVYISRFDGDRESVASNSLQAASLLLNTFLNKTNGHPMRDKLFFTILSNMPPYVVRKQTQDVDLLCLMAEGLELDAKFVISLLNSFMPHDDANEMSGYIVYLLDVLERSALNVPVQEPGFDVL